MNYFQQGVDFYLNKNYQEAVIAFSKVVELDPNNVVAHHNLGITFLQLGLDQEALEVFEYPCSINYYESFISRGAAYRNLGFYIEALKDFAIAFALNPNSATAYSNYSNTLLEFGYPERAIEFIKIANKINPDNTSLLNESMAYLKMGDLIEGWKKYNYRWYYETGESLKPNLPKVEYDGTQNLNGKTIVVYCEQGFGDCIQFVRYISLLENMSAKVILVSKPKLTKLFEFNYPKSIVLNWGDKLPDFDYHVALLDLPKCFDTSINNIPYQSSYLSVDEKIKMNWRQLLGPKNKHRIGITWTSNGVAYNTKFRKIELVDLLKLSNSNYEFISLHFDPNEEESKVLEKNNIRNFKDELGDFYKTAGLMANLDCVITVDTVTAHLSGAMGIPTFVLLNNYGSDWRWFLNRDDSPFYSSIRLFRKTGNTWDNTIADVRKYLEYLY